MRLTRKKVGRYMRLLVVTKFNTVELSGRCHSSPGGVSPGPGGIEIAHVDCSHLHEMPASLGRVLALPGARPDSPQITHVPHVSRIVRPDARLFKPPEAEITHHAAKLEGILLRISLVGVNGDHEIVTSRLADGRYAGGVLAWGRSPDLELASVESHVDPLAYLILKAPAVAAVIPADDVYWHARAVAAPKSPKRHLERLPDGVPNREVEACEGHQPDTTVAKLVVRHRGTSSPPSFDREPVHADNARSKLLPDYSVDLAKRFVLIGRVCLSDNAFIGDNTRNDCCALRHPVVTPTVLT